MDQLTIPAEEKLRPDEEKPEPKFSIEYMDRTADPLENFHTFAYGKWLKNNPIPGDKFRRGAVDELIERNTYVLGKILEDCSKEYRDDTIRGRLGAFYISAMNLARINSLGIKPLKDLFDAVNRMENVDDVFNVIPVLHKKGIFTFFDQDTSGDLRNSDRYALYLMQGGVSLPNKEYYEKSEFEKIRQEFENHVSRMFKLIGEPDPDACASTIMRLETALASKSRLLEDLRDPEENYNKVTLEQLGEFMGNKGFRQYFLDLELDHIGYVIVGQPEFFRNVSSLLEHVPLKEWKIFLKWRIILFAAPFLFRELEEENFDFFYRKLMGLKEMPRRWEKIVRLTDHLFGEALGKIFVDLKFTEDSKKRMEEMVADLRDAFEDRLQNLEWMSLATREMALEKLKKLRVKIGYPSKFIDYSSIRIETDDFFGNVVRATEFEMSRMLKLIGKEVDRELWGMTPPTVNAYFSPTDNEVVFPAGILQPPFFDPDMDDAVNYGATGGTIAHEITHGFDDEGRKFDSNGNLGNWWTKEDEQKFNEKAEQVVELYGSINVLPGINVNGKLTLGENIADIGGVAIALEALEKRLRKHPERNVKIDGFTPVQRFFLGWAQDRRSNSTENFLKMLLLNNHSPDNIRTDIPCMVCKKFDGAFREFSKLDKSNVPKIEIW